jgi:hypothetical protein
MASLNVRRTKARLIRTGPVFGPVPEQARLYLVSRLDTGLDAYISVHDYDVPKSVLKHWLL